MINNNIIYEPVTLNFCGYDFVSIRVDGVDFFPISQLPFDPTGNKGFPVSKSEVSKEFNRLLHNKYSFELFYTTLNPNMVVCAPKDLLLIVIEIFAYRRNCSFARQLIRVALGIELELTGDKLIEQNPIESNKGTIYLIELDSCFKIGFTRNLKQRIKALKTSNSKVTVITTKKGTISDECKLHTRLNPDLGRELYSLNRREELITSFN